MFLINKGETWTGFFGTAKYQSTQDSFDSVHTIRCHNLESSHLYWTRTSTASLGNGLHEKPMGIVKHAALRRWKNLSFNSKTYSNPAC